MADKNFSGSRAVCLYFNHDFGRRLFQKSGLPVIENIPISISVYGGMFLSDFEYHPGALMITNATIAQKSYREIGFGIRELLPLHIRFDFTWQLSDFDTNRFAISFLLSM
jgi:hypothetical protein